MSWLNPGRWLLVLVAVSALVLGYGAWAKHQQGVGYSRAQGEYAKQAQKADAKRESVAAPIAAKQEAAQVQIHTITKTILKEVPVYVPSDSCALPGGFRLLHDAAANGEIPDPARIADAAPVPADVATESVVSNYGIARENAERLRGLQDWVTAQQALSQ